MNLTNYTTYQPFEAGPGEWVMLFYIAVCLVSASALGYTVHLLFMMVRKLIEERKTERKG